MLLLLRWGRLGRALLLGLLPPFQLLHLLLMLLHLLPPHLHLHLLLLLLLRPPARPRLSLARHPARRWCLPCGGQGRARRRRRRGRGRGGRRRRRHHYRGDERPLVLVRRRPPLGSPHTLQRLLPRQQLLRRRLTLLRLGLRLIVRDARRGRKLITAHATSNGPRWDHAAL